MRGSRKNIKAGKKKNADKERKKVEEEKQKEKMMCRARTMQDRFNRKVSRRCACNRKEQKRKRKTEKSK